MPAVMKIATAVVAAIAAMSMTVDARNTTVSGGSLDVRFYSDGNCAKQFDDISVDACYNITGILEPLFPLVPYTGLDATCDSTGAVDGAIYWSLTAGYGDECAADSYIVDLPSFNSGDCAGVSFDSFGFSIKVTC